MCIFTTGDPVHLGSKKSSGEFEESDIRRVIPRYSKENFPNVPIVVKRLRGSERSTGQATLARLLAQGGPVGAIHIPVLAIHQ